MKEKFHVAIEKMVQQLEADLLESLKMRWNLFTRLPLRIVSNLNFSSLIFG